MLTPVREIRFLGLTINSVTLELSLNKTKTQKKSIRMSNSVKQTTNIDPGDNKIDWLVGVNNSSSFTSKVDCRFLQIQKMSHLLENLSYLDKIILNKNSKIKLKW